MNDLRTISQIRQNEEEAFKRIYSDYRDEFCLWLMKKTKLDLEVCKELYQMSVIILFENIRDGKLKELTSSLKTYLFSIGWNKARDYQKQNDKNTGLKFDPVFSSLEDDYQIKEERLVTIEKSLEAIKEPCRGLLIDFYYLKRNMSEIASRYGYKNTDSAKNQKAKCLKKLRSLVQQKMAS